MRIITDIFVNLFLARVKVNLFTLSYISYCFRHYSTRKLLNIELRPSCSLFFTFTHNYHFSNL